MEKSFLFGPITGDHGSKNLQMFARLDGRVTYPQELPIGNSLIVIITNPVNLGDFRPKAANGDAQRMDSVPPTAVGCGITPEQMHEVLGPRLRWTVQITPHSERPAVEDEFTERLVMKGMSSKEAAVKVEEGVQRLYAQGL